MFHIKKLKKKEEHFFKQKIVEWPENWQNLP